MDYQKIYRTLLPRFTRDFLLDNCRELTALELPQTLSARQRAAGFIAELLKKNGIPEVETVNFNLDGTTVYQDKVMPLSWEASRGRLTVVRSALAVVDPVLADYERHPFELMSGSPALPEAGENYRVISFEQLCRGTDPHHALVLFPEDSRPAGERLQTILELGADGVINQFAYGRWNAPDGVSWLNGHTPSRRWQLTNMDRPYLGFSISPRRAAWLRQALAQGEVVVHAECDGRNFAGELPGVSARIPGRRTEEFWLIAHYGEPLADGNSAGVIAGIEVMHQINSLIKSLKIPRPEYSLRLLVGLEFCGSAAWREHLADVPVAGALAINQIPVDQASSEVKMCLAPPPLTAPGNAVMREVINAVSGDLPWQINWCEYGTLGGDAALSDPAVGVPVLYPQVENPQFWHNSAQTCERIDLNRLGSYSALVASWALGAISGQISDGDNLGKIYLKVLKKLSEPFPEVGQRTAPLPERTVSAQGFEHKINYVLQGLQAELEAFGLSEEAEALEAQARELIAEYEVPDVPCETAPGRWFKCFETIVPHRLTRGLPYDLARSSQWTATMPTNSTATGRILTGCDGQKNLQQLVVEAEYQLNRLLAESELKKIYTDLLKLEKLGYIALNCRSRLSGEDLENALRHLGVQSGDTVLVHAALSELGPLQISPQEINDCLLKIIGPEGTLLEPDFGNSFLLFEGNARYLNSTLRPWSPEVKARKEALVNDLLRRPESCRDGHISHEMVGVGKLAAKLLSKRDPYGEPIGHDSAWSHLAGLNAKILLLGCSLHYTSYLHWLETEAGLWYLAPGLCAYKTPSGRVQMAWLPHQLDGCRDFYRGEEAKFFQRAVARGLEIATEPLGFGKVIRLEAAQLYEIGHALIAEDPEILLCDDPLCPMCQNARRCRTASRH